MPANNSTNGHAICAAALYRSSDDKQENSIDRQRDGVAPYGRRKGYQITEEYVFEGIPGDEISRHPDWQRFLRDAEAGKFRVVLVDEPSRLSREDPINFIADVVRPLRRAGIQVDAASSGPLDYESLAGVILSVVHADRSSGEVKNLSRRTLAGMARLAGEGRFYGWICPYGLRVERDIDQASGKVTSRRCVPGPEEEVRAVRFVFDAVANRGWSLRRICRELEARGAKPPQGNGRGKNKAEGRWNPGTVRKILQNRKYVGDLPWNATHQGKYSSWKAGAVQQSRAVNRKTHRHDAEDWIVAPDVIPPLIDRDTFTRAQAALAVAQKRTSPTQGFQYLFTHALVCGDCGAFMRGQPDHGKKSYICSKYKEYGAGACRRNAVGEAQLLKSVLAVLLDNVLDPARLDEVEAEMKRRLEAERDSGGADRLRRQIEALERDIAQGNTNLARLPEDRLAGVVATIRQWEKERDALRARLDEVEGGAGESQRVLAEARKQLWRLRDALEGDDLEAQAAVVREVVSRVEVRFTHEQTHGKRSATGKGRILSRPAGAVLYIRPGLGISYLFTSDSRSPARGDA
jgi:DNA invertase Pin-like site-specific DNA recombinase